MTRLRWLLISALVLALTYEGIAAISGHWPTISQLMWGLEQHAPWWAGLIVVGYIVLGVHLFVRNWKRG